MKFTRYPYTLVSNQPTSTTFASSAYNLINVDVAAVQIDYVASSTQGGIGTIGIQGSVNFAADNLGNIQNAGTFANLPFLLNGSSAVVSVPIPTTPSPIIFDLYGSGITAAKIVYTGSTSGFFTATVSSKRLGA